MVSFEIPKEDILDRLRFENSWWRSGTEDILYSEMKPRMYFRLFYPLVTGVSLNRAILLIGPRRVGKTVMLHHAIGHLIRDGVSARSIFFIGTDNPLYVNKGLEKLMHLAAEAAGRKELSGCYVFFDEIQYLDQWERHLKVLVDSYPKVKFIASGSAAAALRLKSIESGAGRFHDFMLPPLTFYEYLHLKNLDNLIRPAEIIYNEKKIDFFRPVDIKSLNEEFFEYLNYGGYPEMIFNKIIRTNPSAFIKSDIVDKVLLRDLPGLYGVRNVQELNRFFTYLVYNTGKEFSIRKISKDSGLNGQKIRTYFEYLESAFLIRRIHKIDQSGKHFKRVTSFKVYLTNPSLRPALFSPVQPIDLDAGRVVETGIFAQWMHRFNTQLYYAGWKKGRTEGEVDMVGLSDANLKPAWAVEIKWSDRYVEKPDELKSLLAFCKINGIKTAIVTSISVQKTIFHEGIEIQFYPAALYAYAIGANTLRQAGPVSPVS